MKIFVITKGFPSEERFSLVDQIRRASRSVCSNIAEAWRKRKYLAVFKNKLTDAMQEASETQCWLEFCLSCKYIDQDTFSELDQEYEAFISMLNSMERKAIEIMGPLQHSMAHFGKLSGWVNETYHCHLNKGRPTYVAVWQVKDRAVCLMEVIYAGTHEKAPY